MRSLGFAYVANDPVNNIDPNGEEIWTLGVDGRGALAGKGVGRQYKIGVSATRQNGKVKIQIGAAVTRAVSVSDRVGEMPGDKPMHPIVKGIKTAALFLTDTGLSGDVDVGAHKSLDPNNPADFEDLAGESFTYGAGLATPADPDLGVDLEVATNGKGLVSTELGAGGSVLTPTPLNITLEANETETHVKTFEFKLPWAD